MMELIGSILVLLGAIFHFSAGLGMLRMPDAYTRMQAGTKASTLGNTLVLAGLAIYHPGWGLKLLIIVYFVLMTNPVSSHALARAAHSIRIPMAGVPGIDALRDAQQKAGNGT
jgi:multicomponent Na+:H+ antiporter subunit G